MYEKQKEQNEETTLHFFLKRINNRNYIEHKQTLDRSIRNTHAAIEIRFFKSKRERERFEKRKKQRFVEIRFASELILSRFDHETDLEEIGTE